MTRKIHRHKEIVEWLEAHGWVHKPNTWAWYRSDGLYRYKMNDISVRYEKKLSFGWVKVKSAYYSNIKIVNGEIVGL